MEVLHDLLEPRDVELFSRTPYSSLMMIVGTGIETFEDSIRFEMATPNRGFVIKLSIEGIYKMELHVEYKLNVCYIIIIMK